MDIKNVTLKNVYIGNFPFLATVTVTFQDGKRCKRIRLAQRECGTYRLFFPSRPFSSYSFTRQEKYKIGRAVIAAYISQAQRQLYGENPTPDYIGRVNLCLLERYTEDQKPPEWTEHLFDPTLLLRRPMPLRLDVGGSTRGWRIKFYVTIFSFFVQYVYLFFRLILCEIKTIWLKLRFPQ